MAMIVITIINSSSVKPRLLPLVVFRAIESRPLRFTVHVEYILPAPRGCLRIVLVGPLTPFGGIRHRILRNPSQKLQFLVHCSDHLYAIDQILQFFRVAFSVHLDHDEPAISRILVLINCRTHFSQGRSQFNCFFPFDRVTGQGHSQPNQYRDDHYTHHQFDECEATMISQLHGAETVTSVALPIETFCCGSRMRKSVTRRVEFPGRSPRSKTSVTRFPVPETGTDPGGLSRDRSEERRVGKE